MGSPFVLNDDGTVAFDFGEGGQRTLRRPKLKQYRMLIESLSQMRRDLLPPEAATATDEQEVAAAAALRMDPAAQLDKLLEWWSLVFGELGDGPLPDEDHLEPWIFNGTVTRDLVAQWVSVPTDRGPQ